MHVANGVSVSHFDVLNHLKSCSHHNNIIIIFTWQVHDYIVYRSHHQWIMIHLYVQVLHSLNNENNLL